MFKFYQRFFQNTYPNLKHDALGGFSKLAKHTKWLGMIVLMYCFVNIASAQGAIVDNAPTTLGAGETPGIIPATQGDFILPNAELPKVEMASLDLSVEIVPLPIADYTGHFNQDVEVYKEVVTRWLAENPASLIHQDEVAQKLIMLGYYDTLLKWQIQTNHINKISTK